MYVCAGDYGSGRGVKVDLGIPYELWDSRPAEVSALERACVALVADTEELIEHWFFERLPQLSAAASASATPSTATQTLASGSVSASVVRDLSEHLCRRGALRGKYSSTLCSLL